MLDTGAGPYHFSHQVIKDNFEQYFQIEEINDTEFLTDQNRDSFKSLFVIMKRR